MHLYVALMTVSICVVSVITQKNNYGEHRALVLVKKNLLNKAELHRPTSVTKNTGTDDDNKPYNYKFGQNILSSGLSKVYFFCPPDKDTKLLIKNKNEYCQFPIRTKFTKEKLNFDRSWGNMIFNGYSYTKQKIEKHNEATVSTETPSDTVYGFVFHYPVKRVLCVHYIIYSRDLLASDEILPEEKDFITEPTSLIEEHDFEYVEKGLDDMEKEVKDFPLEGRDQISNPQHDYYRATLASRFHFPFVQYKRPLFHYSNITLVHKDILKLFVETQIFISKIKMDELRIFAVPYFHFGKEGIYERNIQKEGNEKSRHKYAPDIIGYLIFDKEEKQGIAIILHNESESYKNNIKSQCAEHEYKMNCKSYYDHLKNNELDEKIFSYAYCCGINNILKKWELSRPFPTSSNLVIFQTFDDLNI